MVCRIAELRMKEVISVTDSKRVGFVSDAEFDIVNGKMLNLIVPGASRGLGLFGREENVIPWDNILRIGEDIILVDFERAVMNSSR
jgi:YlmC/YmxH family sporulation protein